MENHKKITFIKRVVFKDMNGIILKVYEVGDTETYTAIVDNLFYVTSMGGIYFDEAVNYE